MLETLIRLYAPLGVTLIVAGVSLALCHYLLLVRPGKLGSEAKLPRQLLLFALTLLAFFVLILVAPLPESTRNQVLALVGVLLSGVIALSSAAFVTNFMAAVMLRVTRPFKVGDFIRVGEFFGKVSERGLFDTEIQTENRELIAIPNATFINQGVTVTRSSGVIVSATLSLGYDVGHSEVEPFMLEAAEKAGLLAPFVHITHLGDFSVSYRVAGLLEDVESILTARSELNRQLLYVLHRAGVEIASPTIARHIRHDPQAKIMPRAQPHSAPSQGARAEEIVFDKAREIELLAQEKKELQERIKALQEAGESLDGHTALPARLEAIEVQLQALAQES